MKKARALRRAILIAAVFALAAAAAPAQSVRPTLQQLANQAADLEKAMRRAADPVERKRFLEELEKVKHHMGPFDPSGARIKCQAMWHDAALQALDADIKRLAATPAAATSEAHLHARRMAAACLTHGWRIYDGRTKYQVDVFGEYLWNNIRTLDALFDAIAASSAKQAKLDPAGEDAAVYKPALEKAKTGIAEMRKAADAMAKAGPEAEADLVPLLADFLQGLMAVREADLALAELAPKKGKAPAASAEAVAPEPPPMTAQEKDQLAKVKDIAGRLKGDAWAPVSADLARFAAAVEAGFEVPSARPKARELLQQIRQAAGLADAVSGSKVAYPEYVKMRQEELAAIFQLIAKPASRQRGYTRLGTAVQEDRFRRVVESAGLSAATAKGLLIGYYQVLPELNAVIDAAAAAAAATAAGKPPATPPPTAAAVATATQQARALQTSCDAIAATLEKMAAGPPKDMTPRLPECYTRQETLFRGEVDGAAAAMAASRAAAIQQLAVAAERAADLALVVRADVVVKVVMKYRPGRAQAMYAQVLRGCQELVVRSAQPAAPRQALETLVRPFESLDKFPLVEPEYARSVNAIAGRVYPSAVGMFLLDVGAGIDAASAADLVGLTAALSVRPLFGLVRIRAVADACRLERAGAANLVTFSFPDRVWGPFVKALDPKMQILLVDYARNGRLRASPSLLRTAAALDDVYGAVACSQRLTLDARAEGQADVDFLLRNLDRAAVASPTTEVYYGWITGYHAIEAAVTVEAGFDTVAGYHRYVLRSYHDSLRATDLDPGRQAAGKAK
jgi:hypothetical protein